MQRAGVQQQGSVRVGVKGGTEYYGALSWVRWTVVIMVFVPLFWDIQMVGAFASVLSTAVEESCPLRFESSIRRRA